MEYDTPLCFIYIIFSFPLLATHSQALSMIFNELMVFSTPNTLNYRVPQGFTQNSSLIGPYQVHIIHIYGWSYMLTSSLLSVAHISFINFRMILLTAYLSSSCGHLTHSHTHPKQSSLHTQAVSPRIICILINGLTIDPHTYAIT